MISKSVRIRIGILCNDVDSDYKTILGKSEKCTMEVKCRRTVELEIFKTLNNLNLAFMEHVFDRTKRLTHGPNNIQVNVHKTAKYGDKSLRILGPHIWNSLPEHMKAAFNFIKFREYIKKWFENIICVSILTNKYVNQMITTSDLIRILKTVSKFLLYLFCLISKYNFYIS